MASLTPVISLSQPLFNKSQLPFLRKPHAHFFSSFSLKKSRIKVVASAAAAAEKPKKRFVEKMRSAALKMHYKDETKEGEREADGPPIAKWKPSLTGYLKFLADSTLVYQILDRVVEKAAFPEYLEFRNTGLERSGSLEKDLEWFKKQGHVIPKPSSLGIKYTQYLQELSENNPQAFIYHFYMIYFGHNAGGRLIGKKVEKILKGKELEFYRYDGELSQILQNVRDKLDGIAEERIGHVSRCTREEKDHCLEETEKSIKLYGEILRLMLS